MQVTGYSGKTISEKLGIFQKIKRNGEDKTLISIINEPQGYRKLLGELPQTVVFKNNNLDLLHFFTKSEEDLEKEFPKLAKLMKPDGFLWISWPKSSSKIKTDLNENIIRDIGLKNGMVDVKVIAIDKDWSALKFVYRLTDRK